MKLGQIASAIKSPATLLPVAINVVTVLGALGIFSTGQSAAVETLLTAVLGVLAVFGHGAIAVKLGGTPPPAPANPATPEGTAPTA